MPNLIEGLQDEMNRVREVAKVYREYPGGFIAAAHMDYDIKQAEQAIASGDIMTMIDCCQKLKEWEL